MVAGPTEGKFHELLYYGKWSNQSSVLKGMKSPQEQIDQANKMELEVYKSHFYVRQSKL